MQRFPYHNTEGHFSVSLRETIAWCQVRATLEAPVTSLRSPQLIVDAAAERKALELYWQDNPIIRRVVFRRSQLLMSEPTFPSDRVMEMAVKGGRLLVCDYAASDACEASFDASRGFFDMADVPPWDTWVEVFEPSKPAPPWVGWLIGWVPSKFVPLAQAGIEVNPCGVLFWADRRFNMRAENRILDQADLPKWVTNWDGTVGQVFDDGTSQHFPGILPPVER